MPTINFSHQNISLQIKYTAKISFFSAALTRPCMDKNAGITLTDDMSEFNLCIKNCSWNGVNVTFGENLELKTAGENAQWLNSADNKTLCESSKYLGKI